MPQLPLQLHVARQPGLTMRFVRSVGFPGNPFSLSSSFSIQALYIKSPLRKFKAMHSSGFAKLPSSYPSLHMLTSGQYPHSQSTVRLYIVKDHFISTGNLLCWHSSCNSTRNAEATLRLMRLGAVLASLILSADGEGPRVGSSLGQPWETGPGEEGLWAL